MSIAATNGANFRINEGQAMNLLSVALDHASSETLQATGCGSTPVTTQYTAVMPLHPPLSSRDTLTHVRRNI